MKLFSVVVLLAGVCAFGRAQEVVPDFSPGFEKLAALGLPELDASARWVSAGGREDLEYQVRQLTSGMKGNCWAYRSADGAPRHLAMGAVVAWEPEGRKQLQERDVEKDVEKLIATMEKAAGKIDRDNAFSLRHETEGFGRMLVFAAQLHQTKRTDLANRVALAMMSIYPTREDAVDAAVNHVASAFYQQAAEAFFATGDWRAYHRELSALVERFPRGWEARGAVGMMLPQLARQAAGEPAPVPALPDVPIDPAALEIVAAFGRPGEPGKGASGGEAVEINGRIHMIETHDGGGPPDLWLLAGGGEEDDGSPVGRLVRLGMDALPALAALAGDPVFVALRNPGSRSRSYGYDESEEEETLRFYQYMNRPATRGEIAARMLAATLPDGNGDLDEADPETMKELALEFWKTHREDSKEKLAAVFLKEGSSSQAKRAAEVLASSADAEAHRLFEEHVLSSNPAISRFQAVQTYARARRAAAKPFVESYGKLLREQIPDGENEDDDYEVRWMIQQAGSLEKLLKQLDMLVEAQSPRSFAVQSAKGRPEDVQAALNTLATMLEDASPKKRLYAYLEGASAAKDAGVRGKFLEATLDIPWRGNEGEAEETEPAARTLTASELRVWKKFAGDAKEVDTAMGFLFGSGKASVAELAAVALEYSVAPVEFENIMRMSGVIGRETKDIVVERATARLAGNPVPPLPDASEVSTERLAEIVSAAGAKRAEEIHVYLSSLSQDERAAWAEWLADPDEPPVPPSVSEAQTLVVRRRSEPIWGGLRDTPDAGGVDVGFRVSKAGFEDWLQSTAAGVAERSRNFVLVMPADFGPGLSVTAVVWPMPAARADDEDEGSGDGDDDPGSRTRMIFSELTDRITAEDAAGAIVVQAGLADTSAQARWLVRDGKAVADDEDRFDSAAVLELLDMAGKSPGAPRMQVRILSRADADKLSETTD